MRLTEKQRMEKGLIYVPMDQEILDEQLKYIDVVHKYNRTKATQTKKRQNLLKKMFASIGENCYFEAPLYSNFGCKHVYLGNHVYANFNLTLVDDGNIYIGDHVMIAPNVTIATAGHPINARLRQIGYQYNQDVHIGSNVWIGAGSIIMPGVTIGDNTIIGAGSIVTKDIPSGVVAYGDPCKVAREVSTRDDKYFYKELEIDWDDLNFK